MIKKFNGTFVELQKVVEDTRLQGKWESEGVKKTFRTWENGILNWWESTGTIQFQGKAIARTALEQAFNNAMAKRAVTPTRGVNEEDGYYDDDYDDDVDLDEDDFDDQVYISLVPEVMGFLLLTLVKEVLVECGYEVSPVGQSTFLIREDDGTPLFTLAQEGPEIRIWNQV